MHFLKLRPQTPSKFQWDLKNGPLSQSLELLDTQAAGSVQWVLLEMSWTNAWQVIIFSTAVLTRENPEASHPMEF